MMADNKRSSTEKVMLQKVGLQVKKQRKLAGLTQEKLAELTELSSTTISRLENGEQMVSVGTMLRIAQALQIKTGALFDDFDFGTEKKRPDKDFEIVELLDKCSINQKVHIVKYVKLMMEDFPVEYE